MWLDKLKYRDNLSLDNNITFGTEIEFDKARKSYVRETLDEAYYSKTIKQKWKIVHDETIRDWQDRSHTRGGEAVSDILTDSRNTWQDVKFVCDTIEKFRGKINHNCGAHVHIGANILKDNMKYYDRLMKLWIIYEDVILRFCCGENDEPRKYMPMFARSPYRVYKKFYNEFYHNNKLNLSFEEFVNAINNTYGYKNIALSFCRLSKEFLEKHYNINDNWYQYRTLEFRSGNGTLNPAIWQNYINLYTKLLLCCLDDNKNWDMIDKKFIESYNCEELVDYNYEKATEFSNFIFNNDIDKYYFMLQYNKDYKKGKIKIRKR